MAANDVLTMALQEVTRMFTWLIVIYLLGILTPYGTRVLYDKYSPKVKAWLQQVF